MFPAANVFRVDWESEFKRLRPFLEGKGGVVQINFTSEDAAPSKFNHILKEDFRAPGNGSCLSLRIDDAWSTTYTVDDQINAFARKLGEGGVVVDFPKVAPYDGNVLSQNSASGDLTISVAGLTIVNGFDQSPYAQGKRIEAVCDGVRRFVNDGGHFMVVVNDMTQGEQARFWKQFWYAGLERAGGQSLLLIYFVGPKCGNRPHADAPPPSLRLTLPTAIEGDEVRENCVYDDILGLFEEAGYMREEVGVAADGIISSHGHSVLAVQEGLAKLFWRLQARSDRGEA
ncbi:hypothetical protein K2X14_13800 [Acetobacter sp. TBRC 12305]|uniref:Uncharacterized protein n=1 Tax=Acetobacter garciniae TaxID=2817435 RepID=A0A939HM23_9PROT|nr:hypothetical protein [Acetobacter garciniae]MBO1326012.1 hypothetical protein [Acetobacter garciniae]MBX0345912.1 hypothetical protein [Acetobacter garciniae]